MRLTPVALAALPVVIAVAAWADETAGRQFALLVGVKQYDLDGRTELTNLKYTENDVTRLAEVLRGAGYRRVTLMTRSEMFNASDESLKPTAANIRRNSKTKSNKLCAKRNPPWAPDLATPRIHSWFLADPAPV